MKTRIPHNGSPVTTACVGRSADIFPGILRFYVPKGGRVLDMNWGKGRFWKRVDLTAYHVVGLDINDQLSGEIGAEYDLVRADNAVLPFPARTFDACVLDPPFGTGSTKPQTIGTVRTYNLRPFKYYRDLWTMYRSGLGAAWRVLKRRGVIIVKCQDVINSGRYYPAHYLIGCDAETTGYRIIMTFLLVTSKKPLMRHDFQVNPRSNNTYFQVFRKEM